MQENCIFEGVKKLLPGHYLTLEIETNKLFIKKYWEVIDFYNQPTLKISFKVAKEELKQILNDSVLKRMVADVPVGLFLSGGYDSSLVGGILKNLGYNNLETFTIGFEDKDFDESVYAKKNSQPSGL